MDTYQECKTQPAILGTNIAKQLRKNSMFKGLILIRSANDSAADIKMYKNAGTKCPCNNLVVCLAIPKL